MFHDHAVFILYCIVLSCIVDYLVYQGKGMMTTYWLVGRADKDNFTPAAFDTNEVDHVLDKGDMPGEIRPYNYQLCINDSLSRWVSATGYQGESLCIDLTRMSEL